MRTGLLGLTLLLAVCSVGATAPVQQESPPAYAPDGKMLLPKDYRSWIFLSSGFDMSYAEGPAPSAHAFNNVFVNREAYAAFRKTGAWPDRTIFMLEHRAGSNDDPVLKQGQFQAGSPTGLEAHVKDASKGGWGFYGFGKEASATMIPRTASCYSCHAQHAQTDTTFTQFYPALREKGGE